MVTHQISPGRYLDWVCHLKSPTHFGSSIQQSPRIQASMLDLEAGTTGKTRHRRLAERGGQWNSQRRRCQLGVVGHPLWWHCNARPWLNSLAPGRYEWNCSQNYELVLIEMSAYVAFKLTQFMLVFILFTMTTKLLHECLQWNLRCSDTRHGPFAGCALSGFGPRDSARYFRLYRKMATQLNNQRSDDE